MAVLTYTHFANFKTHYCSYEIFTEGQLHGRNDKNNNFPAAVAEDHSMVSGSSIIRSDDNHELLS